MTLAACRPAQVLDIRDAEAADTTAIQRIYAHHVLNGLGSFEGTAPDEAEMARRRAAITARGLPYLVAEHGGRVRGFAYCAPYRTRVSYRNTVEDSIYVAPDAQRLGIGRTLLATLIERCTALGYRQMIAVIGGSNNESSIGLHEALGFRHAGTLTAVGWKLGGWVDTVLLQRALGPGADSPP